MSIFWTDVAHGQTYPKIDPLGLKMAAFVTGSIRKTEGVNLWWYVGPFRKNGTVPKNPKGMSTHGKTLDRRGI